MRKNLKRMALLLLIAVVLIPMAIMTALASGNENLALGKPATASSSYPGKPWTPDKAVDGDTSGSDSRWSSKRATGTTNEGDGDVGTKEQWLQIDLGTVTAVEQVNIYWEAAFATRYEIQTSLDGEEQEALYKRAQVILSEQAASVWLQDLCDLTVMDPALEGLTLYRTYVLDMSTIRYAG